jgi:hypothetical protein
MQIETNVGSDQTPRRTVIHTGDTTITIETHSGQIAGSKQTGGHWAGPDDLLQSGLIDSTEERSESDRPRDHWAGSANTMGS